MRSAYLCFNILKIDWIHTKMKTFQFCLSIIFIFSLSAPLDKSSVHPSGVKLKVVFIVFSVTSNKRARSCISNVNTQRWCTWGKFDSIPSAAATIHAQQFCERPICEIYRSSKHIIHRKPRQTKCTHNVKYLSLDRLTLNSEIVMCTRGNEIKPWETVIIDLIDTDGASARISVCAVCA